MISRLGVDLYAGIVDYVLTYVMSGLYEFVSSLW